MKISERNKTTVVRQPGANAPALRTLGGASSPPSTAGLPDHIKAAIEAKKASDGEVGYVPPPKPARRPSITELDEIPAIPRGASAVRLNSPAEAPNLRGQMQTSTAPINPATPDVRVTSELADEWIRQDLPSLGVPYEHKEVFIRPIDIPILARLSAAMKNDSLTMLIDALSSRINIDVRTLTPSDFNFLLFWLRMESYPNVPYSIPWTSRYGDECKAVVKRSEVEIIELAMTKEEFERDWASKGLCFPTVRDMELLSAKGLSDNDKFMLELAQYVALNVPFDPKTYAQDKMAALTALGPSIFHVIQDFSTRIEHGVKESVKVTNDKFNPKNAIAYFQNTANQLETLIKAVLESKQEEGNDVAMIGLAQRIISLREEAAAMQKDLDEGIEVKPDEEVIALSINVMAFFS